MRHPGWKSSAAAFVACMTMAAVAACGGGNESGNGGGGGGGGDVPADADVSGSLEEKPETVPQEEEMDPAQESADCEDRDADGVKNEDDNCPDAYNPDQQDRDRDGIGDVCECDKHPGGEEPQPTPTPTPKPEPEEELAGRMTGGGSVFTDDGMRVTHGFQLRCDAGDHRQNLQVNWGGGEKFHLLDLTSATCLDDEALDEENPVAGFDTFVATGTGRFNGEDGATVELTFTDDGEPGDDDVATMVIRDAAGNVVLEVSGNLRHGNHQAHRD